MILARFIAEQRTAYRVPHTVTCALFGVSMAWFCKWCARFQIAGATRELHTARDCRCDTVDRAVKVKFTQLRRLHGSPCLHVDLRSEGWTASEKTLAESMRRQGLVAPPGSGLATQRHRDPLEQRRQRRTGEGVQRDA